MTSDRTTNSILLTLFVAFGGFQGWIAIQINTISDRMTRLESTIPAGTADRYHASDASRDFMARDKRVDGIEARVERLEDRR